jgi:hypothetical protein
MNVNEFTRRQSGELKYMRRDAPLQFEARVMRRFGPPERNRANGVSRI